MCVVKSNVLSRSERSCCLILIVDTLIVISSAKFATWPKFPSNPTFGVAEEKVTLEWKYSLSLTGDDRFDSFTIRRWEPNREDYDDIVTYRHDGTVIVYSSYRGRFSLAKNATPELLLTEAEEDDERKYCCKVFSKKYNEQKCAVLKILVRPNITSISRNQTSNETDDVTLSCHATGKPTPNITWSRQGNKPWKHTESVLSLKNVSRYEDGEYRCTARNDAGNATASVVVTVNYPPSIFPVAKSYNFTESEDIQLECGIDGQPPPSVTWKKIGGLTNITYKPGRRLTIANANRTEAGNYTCTAANGIGNSQASALINVNVFFSPDITSELLDQTLNETQDLRLMCIASGNPQPLIEWFKRTSMTQLSSTDGVLIVRNVSRTDSGVYQCKASNGIGNDAIANSTVVVNYKPIGTSLRSDAKGNVVVIEDNVIFSCSANSLPPPQLQLRFNNKTLGVFENGKFTLQRVNVSNEGVYECVAQNVLGTAAIARLNLTIVVPPSINYISHNTTVNETDDLALFCNASGKPEPSVTWSFLGGLVKMKPVANETLFLRRVSRKQTGSYRCTAVNGAGNLATADVPVAINYKPEIKDRPSTEVVSWIRHKTVIKCEAEGFPLPDITWSRNGLVESSTLFQTRSSTLSFTPQEEGNFGVYTCIARNRLGTAKQTIIVQQLEAPQAPEILHVDISMNNLEIHWKVIATNPNYPILGYLVQVRKQHEPNPWMNCTQITIQEDSMKCVMNELETNVGYSVRISARNVAGYGEFTEKEVSTREVPGETAKQTGFPKSMIKWIIIGVTGLVSIVLVIVVIVLRRRSRTRGSRDIQYNERKVTVTSFDNPTLELTEAIDSLRRNQNPED